jgi:hypothetical protein
MGETINTYKILAVNLKGREVGTSTRIRRWYNNIKAVTLIPVPGHHTMKSYSGTEGKASHSLNTNSIWRVSYQLHVLVVLPPRKRLMYPLDRSLDGSHIRSRLGGKEKNPVPARN